MNANKTKREKIVIKKFYSNRELCMWLDKTDMNDLKKELTEKYGKNASEVDLENLEFFITVSTQ